MYGFDLLLFFGLVEFGVIGLYTGRRRVRCRGSPTFASQIPQDSCFSETVSDVTGYIPTLLFVCHSRPKICRKSYLFSGVLVFFSNHQNKAFLPRQVDSFPPSSSCLGMLMPWRPTCNTLPLPLFLFVDAHDDHAGLTLSLPPTDVFARPLFSRLLFQSPPLLCPSSLFV